MEFLTENKELIGILMMPVTYGFVGWFTNVVALKMTFYPLEFVGIPPYLGWQGIVPKKSQKLALKSVNIMTERLIKVEDFFSKVDPDQLEKEFQPVLDRLVPEATREIVHHINPSLRSKLEGDEEARIISGVQKKSEHTVKNIMIQVKENVSSVFNFRSLVLRKLTGPNVKRIVDIFQEVGSKEFKFIEQCGWYLGGAMGILQALAWNLFPYWWTLPIQGVVVGYITNWVALTMIFRPLYEKKMGPIRYQGLFLKRQEDVSKKYSNVFATQVLTARNVLEEILYKRAARSLVETIQTETEEAAKRLHLGGGLDSETSNENSEFETTKKEVITKVSESLANSSNKLETYMGRAMSIENNMFKRMKDLPPEEFEPILRSAFQEDEYVLILIGSVLGAVVGLIQGLYMLYIS
ncbi:DUF445 domain-containing protein [Leptospira yasudae]|uniref:DUF445 domain-containing protein n=1 Tax=Leptospira yasudae TaxID=2202201 RepID=A0A5F2BB72_9LEPT|nr:DUF445 family protein [Leptospira yasudae]MBW0434424.1 DUF445 family protein [Leptospira yasudae]RHX80129.1 DUF445 domain-containing protein [Leptospira yasudae]TGK25746.1 DUF445 family protein [Leptospira yasudae]TGL74523.1 DUF445 family protein [Leptospira yasudae]TGL76178.1 DUF445 family protein [Leptospira yasudae]